MQQENYLKLLNKHWGYGSFKPQQEQIIKNVLNQKDTVVIMPTGGGKSICYQLPALLLNGITLVISPLIALIKDQVSQLKERGIEAEMLSSELTQEEMVLVFERLKYENIKLLYISPERLQSNFFKQKIAEISISLLAIDEAHCISEWGHDFRPSYLKINEIKETFPNIPTIALTATATPKVQQEIVEKLGMKEPKVFSSLSIRENLSFNIKNVQDKKDALIKVLKKHKGSSIVFIRNRKETEEIAAFLNENQLNATFFHSKISPEEKNKRQNSWMKSTDQIMVATNAFGMGIDKANVRSVIHYSIPNSIESYYQEAGRAGRDQLPAFCYLLYNQHDIDLNVKIFKANTPSKKEFLRISSMLYNYFSIAENELAKEAYTFYINHFIKKFELKKKTTNQVIQFLHHSGVLFLKSYKTNSKAQILVNPKAIDSYDGLTKKVLVQLSRNHSGIFTDLTSIDEYLLAKDVGVLSKKVIKVLSFLNKQGSIIYQNKDKQVLRFIVPREKKLLENKIWKKFKTNKENEWLKLSYMHYFVEKDSKCKQQMILKYFGQKTKKCGNCDYCLNKKTTTKVLNHSTLLNYLKNEPLSLNQIIDYFSDYKEQEIIKTLETLLNNGKIKQRNTNFFQICKKA